MIIDVLNDAELYDLTLFKQGGKQARVLRDWGIPFVMGRDGHPRVLREHLKIIARSPAAKRHVAEPRLEGLARE